MRISDCGIIISKKELEENSGIVTVLGKDHGVYRGFVKTLVSKQGSGICQIGNLVDFTWTARLANHVGTIKCELITSYYSKILHDKTKLHLMSSLLGVLYASLRSHESYQNLFNQANFYLSNLSQKNVAFLDYIKMELAILSDTGYSLDLSKCAMTGVTDNLAYISPKSGKAASLEASVGYESKLLKLPQFITQDTEPELDSDIALALDLTGYFFKRYVFHNGMEPHARMMLREMVERNYVISQTAQKILA